ncbi:MAG: Crp/Fnr family transcriptional regulator [Bacillota bacterium]|nr:Crp/Fnr family transcriptional regulator [Bacillota bacterium]
MEKSHLIDLKQFEIFYSIEYSSIQELIKYGQIKQISKNTLLIEEGQENENIYFLLKGMAYHFCLCDLSTKRILNVDEKGRFLNEDALYQEKASSSIEVCKNSVLLVIPISTMEKIILEQPLFSKQIHLSLMNKYKENQTLLRYNSYQNSQERLKFYLFYLAKKFGKKQNDQIEIMGDFSVVFLSQLIGAKRETTSRILNQLIDQHFLFYQDKHLVILQPQQNKQKNIYN